MDTGGVRFRTMTKDEVRTALSWAASEGWNPGLSDAECFFKTDPNGFFCAEAEGRIVGTISVVTYDARFAFAGLFIVAPAFRGRGIGIALYRHAIARAGSRVVGGDGVIAMVPKYGKDGGLYPAWQNARCEGYGGGKEPDGLLPVRDADFEELARYDAVHFSARRDRFLRCWLSRPGHYGLVSTGAAGEIVGYGVRRTCHAGHKIGPLFARDRGTAESLLDGLVAGIPNEPFFLDIPTVNPHAQALVHDRQMRPVFLTARLYTTRSPPPLPLHEVFGITTFELG